MTYMKIGDVEELQRRFQNLKPLVSRYVYEYHLINTSLNDPVAGKKLLEEVLAKLQDLKEDQTNINLAIQMLSETEAEDEYDDSDLDECDFEED